MGYSKREFRMLSSVCLRTFSISLSESNRSFLKYSISDLPDFFITGSITNHLQIRGFLHKFWMMTPCVARFSRCIACGDGVREELRDRRAQFVLDACNRPAILEEITGLDKLQESVQDINIDVSDDGSSIDTD